MDKLIEIGFVDTFRIFEKQGGFYTWWPYRFKARERNIGWRLDYIFTSKNLVSKIKTAFISCEDIGSDHCPAGIIIDY